MLRPDLTLDVAKAEVGSINEEHSRTILYDSDFAISLGRFVKAAYKPHMPGDSSVEALKGDAKEALREILGDLNIGKYLNRFCELPGFDYIDYFLGAIDLTTDLVANAVEHGSGFCTRRGVIVNSYNAENGVILTVDQPLDGQDLNAIYQRVLAGARPRDFTAPRGYMGIRGVGTSLMVNKKTPYVWSEQIPKGESPYEASGGGGTRIIMLETFERVKRVFLVLGIDEPIK
ncbi:MAG: hypothetical protein UT33_C0005G0070 [Candidatus Peregrinibacteria bacterium GW2011_GWC2_39_14]|nr:MAG: hypothetical protein US92_C0001G0070 [Candidatus Peregrinibacteria bacterium GW2011_GWA2_38_36]KKR07126.1 MAG: hypothetical protein UT33_C0005G0070 [Candidatus Peregrinibacteria bacterium GW2011_GWC2_39_14]